VPTRSPSSHPEPSAGFLPGLHDLAAEIFAPLMAEYSLALQPPSGVHDRENSLWLKSSRVGLQLVFEVFSTQVSGALYLYDPGAPSLRVERICPLQYLEKLRCHGEASCLTCSGDWVEPVEPELRRFLRRVANLLGDHARDLLSGDFSVCDEIEPILWADRRTERKREFGTSTGESPRFEGRPTLDELYADLGPDSRWLRVPRTYQAFWDYDYSIEEIATYLETTEAVVEALLLEWDRVD